jgi:hypothetical protein
MAKKINKLVCGDAVKNTGYCDCPIDPKLIGGAMLGPLKQVLTEDQLSDANIKETMDMLILEDRNARLYPYMVFNAITDNSEDPTIFTAGYGQPIPVREGLYNWIFGFQKGGVNLSNALRTFNHLTGKYGARFVDKDNNALLGTVADDESGNTGMGPIPLETLYGYPWKPADGSNPAIYRQQFAFDPVYLNELIAFVKYDRKVINLMQLKGLETIELTLVEDNAPEYIVSADSDCGGTNIYELYSEEFEQLTAWSGVAADDQEVLNPTAVVANDGDETWTLTFDRAVSSISLAAPNILAAAPINVVGYESDEIVIAEGSGS